MIEIHGFSDYFLNLETNEVFTFKSGVLAKLEPIAGGSSKSWFFYRNGQRVRKSLFMLYLENLKKIEEYCLKKVAG